MVFLPFSSRPGPGKIIGLPVLLAGLLVLGACAGLPETRAENSSVPPTASASPEPAVPTSPAQKPSLRATLAPRIDEAARQEIIRQRISLLVPRISWAEGSLSAGIDQVLLDQAAGWIGQKPFSDLGKVHRGQEADLVFEILPGFETRKSAVHSYAQSSVVCRVLDARAKLLAVVSGTGPWTMSDLDLYDAEYRSLILAGLETLARAEKAAIAALEDRWASGPAWHLDLPSGLVEDQAAILADLILEDPRVMSAKAESTGGSLHMAVIFYGSREELETLVVNAFRQASDQLPVLTSPLKVEAD